MTTLSCKMLAMEVAGLNVDPSTRAPILILKEKNGEDGIPMSIGFLEAAGIASVLRNEPPKRPMTHDLFRNFIDRTGHQVMRVEITDLFKNVFYARIRMKDEFGEAFYMEARPSDAVALALRYEAPIFMSEDALEKAVYGEEEISVEVVDDSEEGRQWAEYLDGLEPEAFGRV